MQQRSEKGRPSHLRNTLRERVATWAQGSSAAELRANVRRYLGRPPATEEEARQAIAFAVISAPTGSSSLIDRYVAQAGHLPRAERVLFDEWARARFSLLCVTDVKPGEWIEAHDVLADRLLLIPERTGSESIDIGMWLAVFFAETDGRPVLEGSLSLVPVAARVESVQAALRAYEGLGVAPTEATPAASRQVANAVYEAMHIATRAPSSDEGQPPESPTEAMFEQMDAAWPDEPIPALDGLTPRQAVAQGRRAEVWAVAAAPDGGLWASAELLLRR
ncbi:MAG: hypothetical protein Q8P18_09555 [Pseudomonadota bacterium]|nr:hypothetical protein [Pseudomonadota bacterium]